MNHIKSHIALLFCFTVLVSQAARIVVQQGTSINSIKQGIQLAEAGDTVLVKAGTYREGNIIINKSIVLIGENKPVADGEYKVEVFTIGARHVTLMGFTIMNSGMSNVNDLAGIGGLNVDFATIRNNELINTFFGIHLSNCNYGTVENNTLKSLLRSDIETGNGIHLWQCSNMVIKNNQVRGHRDGIYFEFVTASKVIGNISEDNHRYGLHFMFSHDDDYLDNVFRNNGAGVAVMYTRNVKMINNTFERNWGNSAYGLLLKDINDSQVLNNRFIQNTIGIYMEGTSRTVFTRNYFASNGWAVKLQASCDNNDFKENNFMSNTFDFATNGTLVLNTINRNYWDKYQGYDLNRDGTGDVPFRPVNLYAMIVERVPTAVLLWRSFLVFLLDRAERVFPVVTPENLKDDFPSMKPYDLHTTS
ncbi:MAG: nitrous oxide reductase family maturation protein NosD [Cyclobacteriaceae bacterium]|jgi:nitrous oxidase accessory protein|nr:nitrous oxide reductase family maturation protein NosD [Cyclobacteriaceae bacterium]